MCIFKPESVVSVRSVRSVLANMTLWRTNLGYGGLSENSCMHPGKTTLALWSSMLIFFKRNAMSVRSKGHPVYKSSTESEEKVYRYRDKGTPYHHQQIIIKAWNLLVTRWLSKSSNIWCFWILPFYNDKDCDCMLWILYDLTNTTVLWIGEINWSWNGPSLLRFILGWNSLAKTLSTRTTN